jgi:FtsZ-interacting cell division protein ZipA
MNDLRLILLLFGVVVIVSLYLWDRLQKRLARRRDWPDEHGGGDTDLLDDLKIPVRGGGEDEDFSAVLAALKPGPAPDTGAPITGPLNAGGRGQAALQSGNLITLHVMADRETPFTGPALLSALKEEGLEFGDMGIFHHFGLEGLRSDRPLFHLSNMVEPGYLDPDAMADFTTPGLSLFMLLPTPLDGGVVLDLMLVSARMLARRLGGTVTTHDRKPLTEEYIQRLREQIDLFGQPHDD